MPAFARSFEKNPMLDMLVLEVVLPTGMPVPVIARPFAKNPMPGVPVARYLSNGQMPVCPLPEGQKRACPRAKTGIKILQKCDRFYSKLDKNIYFFVAKPENLITDFRFQLTSFNRTN